MGKRCQQLSQTDDVIEKAPICQWFYRAREDINTKHQLLNYGNMGKNKQKGKKQKNVFQVANKHLKPKNKAKPVTTTLKHINAVKHEKVENLNQIFTEVQRDVRSISKSVAPEPKKQTQIVREPPKESVNVDNAAQLFSQL
ncbi:ribosomal biogenesis factor isoform X1 [Sander lucioperca]|uniref:ribosomal biogenesis factor isoform X1 n=2 Tax=Sander lucioperca TaxID=283035 RepID=UPI001653CCE0|nr:ribosomal biogenesis factor isoform X1 [Sander lucioperca]